MQRRGKGIVDKLPMLMLAANGNAGHVQVTIAHVADGESPFGDTAGLHAGEAERAGDREFAGRRFAGDGQCLWAQRIVASDGDDGRLRSKAAWLKANRNVGSVSGPDCERVGEHLRRQKLA